MSFQKRKHAPQRIDAILTVHYFLNALLEHPKFSTFRGSHRRRAAECGVPHRSDDISGEEICAVAAILRPFALEEILDVLSMVGVAGVGCREDEIVKERRAI